MDFIRKWDHLPRIIPKWDNMATVIRSLLVKEVGLEKYVSD